MRRQVNVFTIARGSEPAAAATADDNSGSGEQHGERHDEIMATLGDIRSAIRALTGEADEPAMAAPASEPASGPTVDHGVDFGQAAALKSELLHIEAAIERTKKELAGLHGEAGAGDSFAGVTNELDKIVSGTESATDTILESAEEIDQNARNLAASLNRDGDRNMAYEIHEHATKIFEACNFQDLTGQRITKVVNTMRYVEDRVLQMIEIWGGLDAFKNVAAAPLAAPEGGGVEMHGPGDNENDPDRVSQDDIDALFD